MTSRLRELLRDGLLVKLLKEVESRGVSPEEACDVLSYCRENPEEMEAVACLLNNGLEYIRNGCPELLELAMKSSLLAHEDFFIRRCKREAKPKTPTFVYLMANRRSGLFKIGRSKAPGLRERTLQGEEPEIEIVHKFQGYPADEVYWHARFHRQRVRGEWFRLEPIHIQQFIDGGGK